MLMPTTTEPMDWDTTVWATDTDMPDTPTLIMDMPTTARGPLMLSQRPMLMPTTTEPMDWDTTVWATDTDMPDTPTLIMDMPTTARGPLMLSPLPMLMPTTATTVMVPGPTTATVWATEDTEATEATTGDKFSASEVQSRSSKRTSLLVI